MKQLEDVINGAKDVKGYVLTRIAITDDAYAYKATNVEYGDTHYEVFERRCTKGGNATISGKVVTFDAKEIYPSSENYGVWAWCTNDINKVGDIMADISRKKRSDEIR